MIVIFGASGDLTSRKLVPALYEMAAAGSLPPQTQVVGVSRTGMSDDEWRRALEPWARDNAKGFEAGTWREFAGRLHYVAGSATSAEVYPALCKRVAALSPADGATGNVLLYLSVAPGMK